MIWSIALSALMSVGVQAVDLSASSSAPEASTRQVYERPRVRPFEPASNFGREKAEGDGAIDFRRAPLIFPTTLDAYRGQYEVEPTDGQTAYDQAVAQGEIDYDTLMGDLDGRWRVLDASGRPVMVLILRDQGADRSIEGAYRRNMRNDQVGPIESGETSGLHATLATPRGVFALERGDDGWSGVWIEGGRLTRVVLRRPALATERAEGDLIGGLI